MATGKGAGLTHFAFIVKSATPKTLYLVQELCHISYTSWIKHWFSVKIYQLPWQQGWV